MQEKFTAVWVSHSSISDFLNCPRAYYLNNVYKDTRTGHKISLINPPMALGQVIHQVIESLSTIPVDKRFDQSLVAKFKKAWRKIAAEKGGFLDQKSEEIYKQKGKDMLSRLTKKPGPLKNKAVKIKSDLPSYWLSDEDNIILCGKIDWLEYLPKTDSVHIIDFKTGKPRENKNSLQLPIYNLLVTNCQNRKVQKASYWYLSSDSQPIQQKLPNLTNSHQKVLKIAKKIKLARKLNIFKCPQDTGCQHCLPLEAIIKGKAKLVGTNDFNQDVYILNSPLTKDTKSSVLL